LVFSVLAVARRGRFGCSGLCAASVFCLRGAGGLVCLCFRWHLRFVVVARPVWFAGLCAGIRVLPSCFRRRPCAGRHLLFFAAAKKSRQKKAAHTANSCPCLRAPNRSYASHGNHVTHVRCQRSCGAHHPLRAPASQRAAPDTPPSPRWQTVCRPSRHTRLTPDR